MLLRTMKRYMRDPEKTYFGLLKIQVKINIKKPYLTSLIM